MRNQNKGDYTFPIVMGIAWIFCGMLYFPDLGGKVLIGFGIFCIIVPFIPIYPKLPKDNKNTDNKKEICQR